MEYQNTFRDEKLLAEMPGKFLRNFILYFFQVLFVMPKYGIMFKRVKVKHTFHNVNCIKNN